MKFTNAAIFVALISAFSVFAVPFKRDVDPALVPQFGIQPGVNPTGMPFFAILFFLLVLIIPKVPETAMV